MPVSYCFDYDSFVTIILKLGDVMPIALLFFAQDCFGYSGLFVVSYEF
jgi:hypothetical protein